MTMPGEAAPIESIVLLGDPRVTAIAVSDVGEDLVDVRDYGLRVSRFRADDADDFMHVRAGLATRLARAEEALPRGVHLLLIEGYRPLGLPRRYFDEYLSSLREASPGSDEERLLMLASRYVSPPGIAPHSAGAAIDLTLCAGDGTEFDLGTAVNATPEESAGACYTHHPSVAGEARRNRATMAEVLGAAGLVNYPTEWWHWSYGDRYWAMATGAPGAIYGSAHRSGGRAVMGVGLGALTDNWTAFEDDEGRGVRAQKLDEGLAVYDGLMRGQPFSYVGQHYSAKPVEQLVPDPPVQRPRPPVWVVGAKIVGKERQPSLERAARWDGLLPAVIENGSSRDFTGPSELADMIGEVKALRAKQGLDAQPYDVIIEGDSSGEFVQLSPPDPASWEAAGATWWIESWWSIERGEEGLAEVRRRVEAGPPR